MNATRLRTLKIDWALFRMAFERDANFEAYSSSSYLDLTNGDVVSFYDEDQDAEIEDGIPAKENRETRERVESEPDRYLRISGLDHGEHHEILKAFLDSDWIDNENTKQVIKEAYFGSIGGWRKSVGESTAEEYGNFRDQRIEEMMNDFLRRHDIEPDWK